MTINADDARTRAESWITRISIEPDDEVILVGEPMETEFGWVFFYNSKYYSETGDIDYALTGNAPIIVMKATGDIRSTGTAHPIEVYLDQIRASIDITDQ